jgi:hypothetical protein
MNGLLPTYVVFSVVEGRWENDTLVLVHTNKTSYNPENDIQQQQHQQQQQQQQHSPSITALHHSTSRHHYMLSPLLRTLPSPSFYRPFTPSHIERHVTRHGIIDSPGGSLYVGEVRDTTSHGQGTRIFPDGSRYDGEWKGGVSWLHASPVAVGILFVAYDDVMCDVADDVMCDVADEVCYR